MLATCFNNEDDPLLFLAPSWWNDRESLCCYSATGHASPSAWKLYPSLPFPVPSLLRVQALSLASLSYSLSSCNPHYHDHYPATGHD